MSDEEKEIVDEEPSSVEASEGNEAIKRLRERLKKAVEEKQEYLEGWQRARADFANYKREEAGIHSDKEERTKAGLIEELLPVLDTLELSRKHSASKDMELVEKQFLDALKKLGVEKFGSVGEEFDPHRHEALAQQTEEHKIISVERSGYKIGNKIIRPAQVII
jgi:molecular chaperone GrpE